MRPEDGQEHGDPGHKRDHVETMDPVTADPYPGAGRGVSRMVTRTRCGIKGAGPGSRG